MVSWSYNHCHVHHWVCYKGVCRKVTNPYAVVTLFEASPRKRAKRAKGTLYFWGRCKWLLWWVSEWLLWWVREWLLWWVREGLLWWVIISDHQVHHLLYGPHVPNLGAVVTLFEAIGYCCFWWCFITNLWSGHHKRWSQCSSSAIWTPCPKSGCSGDTFWGNWLLLFLMIFHHKFMVRSS